MIDTLIILILYMSGGIIEHVHYDSVSDCLKAKRQIERTGWKDNDYKRYACEKRTVELKEGIDGKIYVLKILE